jgi:glycosyltransferase involved in cell wall biosynthesis
MRILVVSYSYTPALTPRAFRWAAVAAELVRRGHEVHVLCAAAGPAGRDADGVVVHRVRDWLLDGASRVTAGTPAAAAASAGGWRAGLRGGVRALWRALYWPDFACGWVIPATRAARALAAAERFDWVVSVSHPFTGHLVGLAAGAHARGARWFVDIGDPFHLMHEPSPNNRRLYRWLNRAVEARVVAGADALSVTTASTQQLYATHFALPAERIAVIPPLLSLPPAPPPTPRTGDEPLRLVFVGTLYRRLRSPRFLLACLAALQDALREGPAQRRVELHFYGALNDCADELATCPPNLRDALVTHGMVGRAEVQQAMVDAAVLVNIGNDSEAQLASKVIEYMAVGRPILNLVSLARDTSVAALADYPAALTLARDAGLPPATVAALRDFVLAPPAVPPAVAAAVRERYSAAKVAARYAALLEAPR